MFVNYWTWHFAFCNIVGHTDKYFKSVNSQGINQNLLHLVSKISIYKFEV